jgi:hypothetical protein
MIYEERLSTTLSQAGHPLGFGPQKIQRFSNLSLSRFGGQVSSRNTLKQPDNVGFCYPLRIVAPFNSECHRFLRHHLKGLTAANIAELVAKPQEIDRGDHINCIGNCCGASGGNSILPLKTLLEQMLG